MCRPRSPLRTSRDKWRQRSGNHLDHRGYVSPSLTPPLCRLRTGRAEQWGSVIRKKDKKSSAVPSYNKDSSANRDRTEFRGGRGGRPARGGARGGAARGASARGGHHEVNGHRAKPSLSAQTPKDASAPDASAPAAPNGDAADADADAAAWGSSTPTTWGGDTAALNGTTPHTPSAATSAPAAPPPAQAPPAAVPAKVVSTPATSKLSWAQIARYVVFTSFLGRFSPARQQTREAGPSSRSCSCTRLCPYSSPRTRAATGAHASARGCRASHNFYRLGRTYDCPSTHMG